MIAILDPDLYAAVLTGTGGLFGYFQGPGMQPVPVQWNDVIDYTLAAYNDQTAQTVPTHRSGLAEFAVGATPPPIDGENAAMMNPHLVVLSFTNTTGSDGSSTVEISAAWSGTYQTSLAFAGNSDFI